MRKWTLSRASCLWAKACMKPCFGYLVSVLLLTSDRLSRYYQRGRTRSNLCCNKERQFCLSLTVNILVYPMALTLAPGNIVRLLAKLLDGISDDAIESVDVPSGCPLVYKIRCDSLKPVASSTAWAPLSADFLGNKTSISQRMQFVKAEVGHLYARDIRQILRQNDWGGKRGERLIR
eukprot:754390-Hanusia_phi.AAC.2